MTLNRVKLGRVVTFMKYLSSIVSLILLALTLNSMNLAELVINEPMNSLYKKFTNIPFFLRFITA